MIKMMSFGFGGFFDFDDFYLPSHFAISLANRSVFSSAGTTLIITD